MITTRRPTDDMIEVAIVSLEEALEADGQAVPDGSTLFETSPLEGSSEATDDATAEEEADAVRPIEPPAGTSAPPARPA
jgi:hypothetical protein